MKTNLALFFFFLAAAGAIVYVKNPDLGTHFMKPIPDELGLATAQSLKISYAVQKQQKTFQVEPERLKDLLKLIRVLKAQKGLQSHGDTPVVLEFGFGAGRQPVTGMFIKPELFDVYHWGMLTLSQGFFEALTDEVARREKRPIDLLGEPW